VRNNCLQEIRSVGNRECRRTKLSAKCFRQTKLLAIENVGALANTVIVTLTMNLHFCTLWNS